MKITEEMFRERFLKKFYFLGVNANNFSTLELNRVDDEDIFDFLYHFGREHNLPIEKFEPFPWAKYFKYGSYGLIQRIKKWLGKEYDKYFFEEEEPLYYDTLRDYFFGCLEKIEKSGD